MFYLHFRMKFTGNVMPPTAQMMMWLATAGIYAQALGVLVMDMASASAATACRVGGMVLTYIGFAGIVYYGITAATIESVPVEVFLELITAVVVLQIGIVVLEEYMKR